MFADRGLQDEDYADWAVSIGVTYNKAVLCPEINVANGFIVSCNARRYYRWWYSNRKAQADRTPGLRTTVSSKEKLLNMLSAMVDRQTIIMRDASTLDELRNFVKSIKTRQDGTQYIRMMARAGHKDDRVASCWIYAGTRSLKEIEGRKRRGFAII